MPKSIPDALSSPPPGSQSLLRALDLLNHVARAHDQGLLLRDLVQVSRLDRTTAWRLVANLQHWGVLERDAIDGRYRMGALATAWGAASLGQSALVRQCQPAMKTLARLSGDNVFLVLRQGDYSHCLHLEQGEHGVRSFRQTVGESRLLGLGVASIAMLAALDDASVQSHCERHRETYELEGVTRSQLLRWVQTTRQRGFSYRNTAGIAAVGLHWLLGGVAIAALSIGASKARLPLSRAPELAALMRSQWPVLHTGA